MCTKPIHIHGQEFACGRCAECLRKKTSNYMQLLSECARQYDKPPVFFTLTYDNNRLPLYVTPVVGDDLSGDKPIFHSGFLEDVTEESPLFREYYFNCYDFFKEVFVNGRICKVIEPVDHTLGFTMTPSLRRRDIKLWLKRCRKNFPDLQGKWKYFIVGEYGPTTNRPHYHGLIYGLEPKDYKAFFDDWNKHYGRASVQRVKASHKDYQKVSRYCAKYINKGDYEPEFLKLRKCQSPHIQRSTNMLQFDDRQLDWYLGRDLGIDTEDWDIPEDIIKRVADRQVITIDGYQYRIGKCMKDKLYKKYYEEENPVKRALMDNPHKKFLRNCPLQTQVADYLRNLVLEERSVKLSEAQAQPTAEAVAVATYQVYESECLARQDREKTAARKLRQDVGKSEF